MSTQIDQESITTLATLIRKEDLEKITIVTITVNNNIHIGLSYGGKIHIDKVSQIKSLSKVTSLKDLVNIKDAYGNIIFHNENMFYASNNIDSTVNENSVVVRYKTSIYEREKEEMRFTFKVKIPLDKGILYISNFLDEYDVVT